MKKAVLALLLLICIQAISQNMAVSGYWYGKASLSAGKYTNNYLVELIIREDRTQVKGILNYYFKQTFRSLKVTGRYNPVTRQLTLFDIPVTFHGSTAALEIDCIMDFRAMHRFSQISSNLIGAFESKPAYRYTCGFINFNLTMNADASKEDSILRALREYKETYQVWKPTINDTLIAANIIPRKVVNYVIEDQYKKRESLVANEIVVDSDSLRVDFYDNGEIDGDSISIFYNNQLIAFNRLLSTRSVHFDLKLDPSREINEITMFADNLGSIPPNTALMIVTDGKKRYDIRMASSLEKNATLKIRRRKQ